MDSVTIGVIGGSGLYTMPGLTEVEEYDMSTPFGPPSGVVRVGTLAGQRVAFIARHGKGHVLTPTEVPYRANIYALKTLGVQQVISVSAVGSLREKLAPGHIVVPDNLIDLTYADQHRVHNLKYFTWVEQQGKTYEEIIDQWYDENYWTEFQSQIDEIDELIIDFNNKVGLI